MAEEDSNRIVMAIEGGTVSICMPQAEPKEAMSNPPLPITICFGCSDAGANPGCC